jgi:hypothetical protein
MQTFSLSYNLQANYIRLVKDAVDMVCLFFELINDKIDWFGFFLNKC